MFPKDIALYLNKRGINDDAIKRFGLWWNGNEIVISVKDEKGKKLFNKYRRSPFVSDGPKYRYDVGGTTTLFNYKSDAQTIIIPEGEFDCILLDSMGFPSASSTGGSGSFKKEWVDLFDNKEVFICYDTDEAGVRGAVRIAWMFQGKNTKVKLISFPIYFTGKDVTDYFKHHNKEHFKKLVDQAQILPIPVEENVKNVNSCLAECIMLRRQQKIADLKTDIIDEHVDVLNNLKRKLQTKKKEAEINQNITDIKQIPVSNFIEFNIAGFSKCLWHSEKSPSMKYYPQSNTVFCFGCQRYADVIAIVMELNKCTFLEAVELLKKTI